MSVSDLEVGLAIWLLVYGPAMALTGLTVLATSLLRSIRRRRLMTPPAARTLAPRAAALGVLEAARGGGHATSPGSPEDP